MKIFKIIYIGIFMFSSSLYASSVYTLDSFLAIRLLPIHAFIQVPVDPIYEESKRAIEMVEWERGIVGYPLNFVRVINASNLLSEIWNRNETNAFKELEVVDLFLNKFMSVPNKLLRVNKYSTMKARSFKHLRKLQRIAQDVMDGEFPFEDFCEKLNIWFVKYRYF